MAQLLRAHRSSSLSECHLPPTFQSWFTITNLHVWLLTGTAVDDPWGQSEKTGHYFGRYDYANYPGAYGN